MHMNFLIFWKNNSKMRREYRESEFSRKELRVIKSTKFVIL